MRLITIPASNLVLSVLTCALIPFSGYSQSYNTTLGLRLGDGIGITARQRVLKKASLEGLFYQHHKSDQTVAGLLIAHHMPVLSRRLNLYAGGGMAWAFSESNESPATSYKTVMINAGLEFTIARLNLSWDFIPLIPISNEDEGLTTMTAFSIRYVLVKKTKNNLFQKDKKKKKRNKHKAGTKKSRR